MATAAPEAPAATSEPGMTPIGEVFKQAMADQQEPAQKPVAESTAPEKATPEPRTKAEAEAEIEPEAEPAPTSKKPASVLEAALSDPAPADGKKEDAEPLPETLPNENRGEQWKRARSKIATLETTLAERDRAIAELSEKASKTGVDPELQAKYEQSEKENAELRDAITAANVELLPEFRAKYIDGVKALVGKAQDKIKAYGGDAEALVAALQLPEGTRRETAIAEAMGENISELGRTKINGIIAQIDSLNEEAQTARADSQQSYERLTAKQKEQMAAQQQEAEARKAATFEAVTKRLQTEVPTLRKFDPSLEGAEDWNAGVDTAFANSQKLFGPDVSPEMVVAAAVKGSDYDRVVGLWKEAHVELAAAKKQLAEYDGTLPDVRGGKQAPKTGPEANIEKSPGEIFREKMSELTNQPD